MSKINFKGILKESKDKNYQTDARLTQPNTSKNNSSESSSIIQSASSNLSLTFMKEIKYPRLFSQSPQNSMLFSFNPQSTKNVDAKSSISRSNGVTSGTRTPSSSKSYSSFKNFFESSNRKNENKSVFAKKKPTQNKENITIDLFSKQPKIQKKKSHHAHHSSLSKDFLHKPNQNHFKTNSLEICQNQIKEENIKVFIKLKPRENTQLLNMENYLQRIDEKHLRIDDKIKAYDHIFSVDSQQEEIFQTVGKSIVQRVVEGYNGTIFAYGQTGSGKTYTIFGQQKNEGLIPRTVRYLFEKCKQNTEFQFSLLEIYKEDLIDLLNGNKSELKIKQTGNGVYVDGLSKMNLANISQFLQIIEQASKNRRVTSTKINEKSSRSHTILTIYLKNEDFESKMCLIDLAGSQKINKAGVTGEALEETKKINFSLSCLGNVINALVTRKKNQHIPFRDSKLTRLLKDSLTGRFKTSVIVNCSTQQETKEESISSLKFADRTKKVRITISKAASKNKENIEYLHLVIRKLTSDLENTKKQLNKYKEICQDEKPEESDLTGRQTIPSERININEKMNKYGKQNVMVNNKKDKPHIGIDLNEISSLNVSKSMSNIFGDLSGPSVSSLSHRCEENSQDLSLNFSLHRTETNREKVE